MIPQSEPPGPTLGLACGAGQLFSPSVMVRAMNFLAHLYLAGDDEGLRLGAMLGDFVRGNVADMPLPRQVLRGILLHRHIDQYIDSLPEVAALRERFAAPFRRYAGIIIDLAFDHELAAHWNAWSSVTLEDFDREIRRLLDEHAESVPETLRRFMKYADRRGLFAAYRDESEILYSLRGVGTRLSKPNPLHRVGEIWPELRPWCGECFNRVFPQVQKRVGDWVATAA